MPVQMIQTPTERQDGDVYIVIRNGEPANVLAHGDGLSVLSGTINPVAEDGVNGEFYINTTSWQIFGPKAAGAWPAGIDLKGTDGVFSGDSDGVPEGTTNLYYTDERARDALAAALTAGSGITITPDDAGNIITIASSITQYTDEMARDAIGTTLTAGTGISLSVDDGADTITITSTVTQYTDEMARDALGAALTAGTGISITPNDGADTITVASTITQYTDADAIAATFAQSGWKGRVHFATTGNVNLSTIGLTVTDGHTPVVGETALVLNQTTKAQNGIYTVGNPTWTRRSDADTASELAGAICSVMDGTQWGGLVLQTTFKSSQTLDTDDVNFYQVFSESGAIIEDDLFMMYNAAGDKFLVFDVNGAAAAGTYTLRPPAGTGTHELVGKTATQTLTNKTIALGSNTISGTAGLPFELLIAVGDETTAHTTGTAKVTFRMPRAVTITSVKASLVTAPTGGTLFQFDVNKNGTTIFSTNPTFDASEDTTTTAATASVISGTTINVAADDKITIDIDAVGSTVAGAGLKVCLIGTYQ